MSKTFEELNIDASNGFHINAWMIMNLELNHYELMVFAFVHSYSQGGKGCYYGSLEAMEVMTAQSKSTLIRSLNSLIEKGLIVKFETSTNKWDKRKSYKTVNGVEKFVKLPDGTFGKPQQNPKCLSGTSECQSGTSMVSERDFESVGVGLLIKENIKIELEKEEEKEKGETEKSVSTQPEFDLTVETINNRSNKKETPEKKQKKGSNQIEWQTKLEELGADPIYVRDFLLVRKKKNKTFTETSFNFFLREVEEAKRTVPEVVQACAERGWEGFQRHYQIGGTPPKVVSDSDFEKRKQEDLRRLTF